MQKDCYWYVDKKPGNGEAMAAMCIRCADKFKTGFFWEGSKLGYGNYELKCYVCGEPINTKEKNE